MGEVKRMWFCRQCERSVQPILGASHVRYEITPDGQALATVVCGPVDEYVLASDYDEVREDRDLWRESEAKCNKENRRLEGECDKLRRHAEALAKICERFKAESWRVTCDWSESEPWNKLEYDRDQVLDAYRAEYKEEI